MRENQKDSKVNSVARTYARRIRSDLGGLAVLTTLEQLLVLLDVEVIGTRKVCATRELERKLGVVKRREDVRNDSLLVHRNAQHLALLIDTDDTVGNLVLRSDEDGLA